MGTPGLYRIRKWAPCATPGCEYHLAVTERRGDRRIQAYRYIQRCKRCESYTLRFGTGRQKWSLNDGQIPTLAGCVYM
jgi:hypothetical protein